MLNKVQLKNTLTSRATLMSRAGACEAVDQRRLTMINKLLDTQSNTIYNVEKVKLNKAPRHFFQEGVTVKDVTINGVKTQLRMRAERTQYVLFSMTEVENKKEYVQNYYIRNHSVIDATDLISPKVAK